MSDRHPVAPRLRIVRLSRSFFGPLLAGGLALLAGAAGVSAQAGSATAIGPDGGPLDAFAASRDSKILYASSPFAGFFRSTDGGTTWVHAGDNPSTQSLALAIDSANDETVYALTRTGLFRSTDAGTSWRNLNSFVPDVNACDPQAQRCGVPAALLADPFRSGTLFAAFSDVGLLFRSRDSGATWQPAVQGVADRYVTALAAHPKEPGHLFAGTDRGVYESRDGGDSWTLASNRPSSVVDLAIDSGPDGTLAYAVGLTPPTRHAPICTTITRRLKAGRPFVSIDGAVGRRACFPVDLEADPSVSGVAYLADSAGVSRTTNGGKTWGLVHDRPAKAILASPGSPGTLFVQAQPALRDGRAALRKSEDGGATWKAADHGLVANRVQKVVADPSAPGTLFVQVGSAELHKTSDGGATWRRVEALPAQGELDQVTLDPLNPGTLYAHAPEGVWKSTDRGASWTRIFSPGALALAFDPTHRGTLYAVSSDQALLHRSMDGGLSWTRIGDTSFRFANLAFAPPAIPGGPAILYGTGYRKGTDPYAWDYRNELRRSTDGGQTWETLITTAHFGTPFTALLVPPFRPQAVVAAFTETAGGDRVGLPLEGGVYRSLDGGRNWKVFRLAADKPPVLALILDRRSPDRLFAGSTGGRLYTSTDGGGTWSALSTHLPAIDVDTLELDPRDPQTLFAGLDGGSVYRIALER